MHLFIKIVSITILLIGIINFSAFAVDKESLAQQAEQAGKYREALANYVKALQSVSEGSSKDQELREKIIKLVQKIQPPPVVPEEIIKYEGRAEAAVRNAKTPEDYLDASKEYKKALLIAPWVASYYFNLGVVLEKAGKPDEAVRILKLYLLASPDAQDAREVQKRIAGLEYETEKKVQEEMPETKFRSFLKRFNGSKWRCSESGTIAYEFFELRDGVLIHYYHIIEGTKHAKMNPHLAGTNEENWRVVLNSRDFSYFQEGTLESRFNGSISEDGDAIILNTFQHNKFRNTKNSITSTYFKEK